MKLLHNSGKILRLPTTMVTESRLYNFPAQGFYSILSKSNSEIDSCINVADDLSEFKPQIIDCMRYFFEQCGLLDDDKSKGTSILDKALKINDTIDEYICPNLQDDDPLSSDSSSVEFDQCVQIRKLWAKRRSNIQHGLCGNINCRDALAEASTDNVITIHHYFGLSRGENPICQTATSLVLLCKRCSDYKHSSVLPQCICEPLENHIFNVPSLDNSQNFKHTLHIIEQMQGSKCYCYMRVIVKMVQELEEAGVLPFNNSISSEDREYSKYPMLREKQFC